MQQCPLRYHYIPFLCMVSCLNHIESYKNIMKLIFLFSCISCIISACILGWYFYWIIYQAYVRLLQFTSNKRYAPWISSDSFCGSKEAMWVASAKQILPSRTKSGGVIQSTSGFCSAEKAMKNLYALTELLRNLLIVNNVLFLQQHCTVAFTAWWQEGQRHCMFIKCFIKANCIVSFFRESHLAWKFRCIMTDKLQGVSLPVMAF